MISYENFKILFNKFEVGKELEIYFDDDESYMIAVKENNFTYGKSLGSEVLNCKSLDETNLKDNWNKVKDILLDFAFSIITDKEEISKKYKIEF